MRKGGPLRSRSHPFGVPGLPAHQQAAVTAGNCFLRFSISLMSICRRMGIACMLENPHGSGIWQNPLMIAALQWTESKQHVVDFCCFGTPWRKRTRVLAVHACLPNSSVLCRGSCKLCSETGVPHVRLMGKDPKMGRIARKSRRATQHPGAELSCRTL